MGVANRNPSSAKFISAKICRRPIRENFISRKFGAIRYYKGYMMLCQARSPVCLPITLVCTVTRPFRPSPSIFSFLQSAVTHNSPVEKTCELLTWTAPPNGTGPVFFQWAVVVRYSRNINMFYAPISSMMINESENFRVVQILLAPHPGSFLFWPGYEAKIL